MALRDTLADLFPTRADLVRVLSDAGIDAARIPLGSSAVNDWTAALAEAERLDRVVELVSVALREYGNHAGLKKAIKDYLIGRETKQEQGQATEDDSPMPMDERDRADIRKLGEEIHKIRNILTQMSLEDAGRVERRKAWEERTTEWQHGQDKRLENIEVAQRAFVEDVTELQYSGKPNESAGFSKNTRNLIIAVLTVTLISLIITIAILLSTALNT